MEYVMPNVEVGRNIVWRHSPTSTPMGAIVTAVYDYTIDCNVVLPESRMMKPQCGVRYHTDPDYARLASEAQAEGVWDFTERDKQIDGLLREFYKK